LPPPALLRLVVAATKCAAVAEGTLDAAAAAAAMTLPGWTMDDASKLLLAVAKAKGGACGDGVERLYIRASEVLSMKLREFSSVQLIKVLLAIGQVLACRPLLEAAAGEAVSNRLTELPSTQQLLLTQALLPLGAGHSTVIKMLEFWTANFNEANRVEDLLTDSMGAEMVKDRRVGLEAKGQVSADQIAKLAQTLAPKAPDNTSFWQALAGRFVGGEFAEGIAGSLTAAGKASIEAAFPQGEGPEFAGKAAMLKAVKDGGTKKEKPKEKEKEKARDKSRDRGEGDAPKSGAQGPGEAEDSDSESKAKKKRKKQEKKAKKEEKAKAKGKAVEESSDSDEKTKLKSRKKNEDKGKKTKEAGKENAAAAPPVTEEDRKRWEAEDEERRRLMRERRAALVEEKKKADEEAAKAEEEEKARRDVEEQEKRRLMRERRSKLKSEEEKAKAEAEEKKRLKEEEEAEKRRLQRERRKKLRATTAATAGSQEGGAIDIIEAEDDTAVGAVVDLDD